ncbi:MAG: hypothetical protein Q9160_006542 [Pyrenula sp. 1 TL-2023]
MSSVEAPFEVLICHGSYHTPEPYQPFIEALQVQGVKVHCPQLPTSDLTKLNVGDPANPGYDNPPPTQGHPQPADDAVVLRQVLKHVIAQGKYVVVLGHSSGGFVAAYITEPEVQAKVRKSKGQSGGVIGLFFQCALMVPPDESVHTFFQPKDGSQPIIPPYIVVHKHGFFGLLSTKDAKTLFFNGLDDDLATKYEKTMTASPVFTTVLKHDPYADIPCAYLICEQDQALPSAYQEYMVQLQSQRPGVDMTVYRAPSGHSPQLSWTKGLVKTVMEFGHKALLMV